MKPRKTGLRACAKREARAVSVRELYDVFGEVVNLNRGQIVGTSLWYVDRNGIRANIHRVIWAQWEYTSYLCTCTALDDLYGAQTG